jgi:hypothetical protein
MLLATITDKIQALLGEATATTESDFALWFYDSAAAPIVGRQRTKSNGVAAVDICASPPAATMRYVKGLTFKNRDTIAHTFRVTHYDGAQSFDLSPTFLVPVGGGATWTNEEGWQLYGPGGILQQSGVTILDGVPWTPQLTLGGAAVGLTYASRGGVYSRIGSLVVAAFQIDLSAKGSSVGNAQIGNFPFPGTVATINRNAQASLFVAPVNAAVNGPIGAIMFGAVNAIDLQKWSGTNFVPLTDTDVLNNTSVRGYIAYFM